jgi:hypothetical protein
VKERHVADIEALRRIGFGFAAVAFAVTMIAGLVATNFPPV